MPAFSNFCLFGGSRKASIGRRKPSMTAAGAAAESLGQWVGVGPDLTHVSYRSLPSKFSAPQGLIQPTFVQHPGTMSRGVQGSPGECLGNVLGNVRNSVRESPGECPGGSTRRTSGRKYLPPFHLASIPNLTQSCVHVTSHFH